MRLGCFFLARAVACWECFFNARMSRPVFSGRVGGRTASAPVTARQAPYRPRVYGVSRKEGLLR